MQNSTDKELFEGSFSLDEVIDEFPTEVEIAEWEMVYPETPVAYHHLEVDDAFSKNSRNIIFKRDRGICQFTGKRWDDGWMMHCMHDHDRVAKYDPGYDDPRYGKLGCVEAHVRDHIRLFLVRGDDWSAYSLGLLVKGVHQEGLRTRKYYARRSVNERKEKERNRKYIAQILAQNNLDYNRFLRM